MGPRIFFYFCRNADRALLSSISQCCFISYSFVSPFLDLCSAAELTSFPACLLEFLINMYFLWNVQCRQKIRLNLLLSLFPRGHKNEAQPQPLTPGLASS